MDVTSLYPWVNKNGIYPIGHPEVITRPKDQNIRHYFGVAKVDVIPPFELYHPVLPYRHNGKLVMPLCRSCVEEEMGKPLHEKSHHCTHSPEQRLSRGTWCTPELQKTVEMGYTIVTIHEVWHFPKHQRKIGLFATCWARLKLYESLEKLGQQALYFDTDSVIYRWKPGQPDIPLGDFLGDMTD